MYTVLVVQLQQTLYNVQEQNDIDVCFDVVEGVLAFDINSAVSLASFDGSAIGKLTQIKALLDLQVEEW